MLFPKRRSAIVLAWCWIILLFPAPHYQDIYVAQTGADPTTAAVLAAINAERAVVALPPLTLNTTLARCAQDYSAVLAARGSLSHSGPDGSTPGQRLTRCAYPWLHYGENLAAGYRTTQSLVRAWMASPGHRRNILNPKLRELGFGHTYRANDPQHFYDYYVLELAVRK